MIHTIARFDRKTKRSGSNLNANELFRGAATDRAQLPLLLSAVTANGANRSYDTDKTGQAITAIIVALAARKSSGYNNKGNCYSRNAYRHGYKDQLHCKRISCCLNRKFGIGLGVIAKSIF